MYHRKAVLLSRVIHPTVCLAMLFLCITVQAKWEGTLRFRSDGTFKIVQFTDLHMGEEEGKDNNTIKVCITKSQGSLTRICSTAQTVAAIKKILGALHAVSAPHIRTTSRTKPHETTPVPFCFRALYPLNHSQ